MCLCTLENVNLIQPNPPLSKSLQRVVKIHYFSNDWRHEWKSIFFVQRCNLDQGIVPGMVGHLELRRMYWKKSLCLEVFGGHQNLCRQRVDVAPCRIVLSIVQHNEVDGTIFISDVGEM